MLGRTNAAIPLFNIATDLQYSYDGIIWKKFNSSGQDNKGCASVDLVNNIVQVNTSGYDIINEAILYNTSGSFYLKLNKSCNIYYCLVGGGGGGSGSGATGYTWGPTIYAGGGGAGGQVIYNKTPMLSDKNIIFRIQIGTGGVTGGGNRSYGWANLQYKNPEPGNPSFLYKINNITNEETLIQTALGGNGASYTAFSLDNNTGIYSVYGDDKCHGGVGIAEVNTSEIYSKSSAGGNGERYTSGISAGEDGTLWPQNNTYYGGGGGGAAASSNPGQPGGAGGGGHGGKAPSNTNIPEGEPGTTGGGGGGGSNSNFSGSNGGTGICLIKFV